jgi:tripartite-type tricarboxylate transporter receptor subunit TctC
VDRDLTPLTRTGMVANVLVVYPGVPADTVQSLVALAKSKPGQMTYASQGVGSNGQMTGELFKQQAGIDVLHVPYKGSAPAVQDLLSGQVQIMFDNLPSVLPLIRSGKLKALAVTTVTRSSELPDTPTIAESGLPGFNTSAWFALLAPKAISPALRQQIETAVVTALTAEDTKKRLQIAGVDVAADGAAELGTRIQQETKMWREVVEKAGIKVE